MKIIADRDVCVSAGMCVLTAPELFDQDEADGRVELRRAVPDRDQEESAGKAVEVCPSGALRLSRD